MLAVEAKINIAKNLDGFWLTEFFEIVIVIYNLNKKYPYKIKKYAHSTEFQVKLSLASNSRQI